MGYTNYWYQRRSFTDEEWSKVLDEYDYIKDVLGGSVIVDESKPEYGFECKEIVFNGNPENKSDHETFVLTKEAKTKPDYEGQDISFNFCKTRMNIRYCGMAFDFFLSYLTPTQYGKCQEIDNGKKQTS